MRNLSHTLILQQTQEAYFSVRCEEAPRFRYEVTGSYLEEAIERAIWHFERWLSQQRERGVEVAPSTRGGGVVIRLGGAAGTALDEAPYLSLRDLKRSTGLSESTIRRRVKDGSLPAIQVGNRVLFETSQVRAALARGARSQQN